MSQARHFLLLQGPMGSFFKKLAAALRAEGHTTLRINFNGGDRLHFSSRHAKDFIGKLEDWPQTVRTIAQTHRITDLVVYGDCRPLHQIAIAQLRPLGVRIHVFEEGYFRPGWVTLEEGGVNGFSTLPKDAEFYRAYAKNNPVQPPKSSGHGASFPSLARHTISYYVASALLSMRYRNYLTHRQRTYQREGVAWVWRLTENYLLKPYRRRVMNEMISDSRPYVLVLLQLLGDSQITHHSPYHDMYDFLSEVLKDFAHNAPKELRLIVKNHPLDNGLTRYASFLRHKAASLGLGDRILYIDGGHLPTLFDHAIAAVTVNSTSGLSAVHHELPTRLMGSAVYNIEGLVSRQSLSDFWKAPQAPDKELYEAFRSYVITRTQCQGGFYTHTAIRLAVRETVARLLATSEEAKTPRSLSIVGGTQC